MSQSNRLSPLTEQIDDRRTTELEHLGRHITFERFDVAIETDVDVDRTSVLKSSQGLAVESDDIEEQEFLGKGEVLGHQLVRRETTAADDSRRPSLRSKPTCRMQSRLRVKADLSPGPADTTTPSALLKTVSYN